MTTYFTNQRLGTMVSFVTSLMLISGCRSASVNSREGVNSTATPSGIPFYRSFERSPRPYDGAESPTLEPIPPTEIPPVPGYTDPTPEPPPSPSAQKPRWKPKVPSFGQRGQVNQTGANADGTSGSARLRGMRNSQRLSRSADEEVVRARSSGMNAQPELAEAVPFGANEQHETVISPGFEEGDSSDQLVLEPPKLKTPIKTRYGVIRDWPENRPRSKSSSKLAAETDGPVLGLPESDQDEAESASEVPHLLPPSA